MPRFFAPFCALAAVSLLACAPDEGASIDEDQGAISFHGASNAVDSTMPDVDAIGYDIALTIDPKTRATFTATVVGQFVATRALTSLELDLEGNEVKEVFVNDAKAAFARRGDKLVVTTGSKNKGTGFSVKVTYSGKLYAADGANPNDFTGYGGLMTRKSNAVGHSIISSLNWPYKARRWLPLRDHPRDGAMMTMTLTFPRELTVLANGVKKSELDNKDGTKTWTYEALTPMPTYDFHLAAYDGWVETKETSASTLVHGYSYKEHAAAGHAIYDDLPQALSFYSGAIGSFRFGKEVRFLEEPIFGGGMEHAGIVSIDETLFESNDAARVAESREVVFHELAHHWSGNLARIATWNDFWLSEGFTDYFTGRALEAVDGEAAGLAYWKKVKASALSAEQSSRHALRPDGDEVDVLDIFDGISYKKGAFVMRVLEKKIGRDKFTAFLRGWFDRHAFKAVTTEDFKKELEGASGEDLETFFDSFVYEAGAPTASVSMSPKKAGATVTVNTLGSHVKCAYDLELQFTGAGREKKIVVSVTPDKSMQTFDVALDFTPTSVTADPNASTYGRFSSY